MKIREILFESTELYAGNEPVAVRSSQGRNKPPRITMLITKDEWNKIKHHQASTDTMDYDVATAEMVINDWVKRGGEVYWKTATDWNREARYLEKHRFRDDPEVSDHFDSSISSARDKARSTVKSTLKSI